MSLVQQNGTYLARPLVTGVEERDKGTVQFTGLFQCTQMRQPNGAWAPVVGDQKITAFLNLITKAGTINEINARALKDALGWSGTSFAELQREEWPEDTEVQLVIDEELYEGAVTRKVKYLNPRDYAGGGGGVKTADSAVIQSLDMRYGAMLRAMNGGTNPSTPRKNGAAAKPSAPAPAKSNGAIDGKQLAWAAFVKKVDEYSNEHPDDAWSNDKRVEMFKKVVGEAVGGKDPKTFTPTDWATVKHQIDVDFSPAVEGLIPF